MASPQTDSQVESKANRTIRSVNIQAALDELLLILKRRKQLQYTLNGLIIAAAFIWLAPGQLSVFVTLGISASLFSVCFAIPLLAKGYRRINRDNLLEHINRQLPDYQESAQLLVAEKETLTLLQQLQQEKIIKTFQRDVTQGRLKKHLPAVSFKQPLYLTLLSVFVIGMVQWGYPLMSSKSMYEQQSVDSEEKTVDSKSVTIEKVSVAITPPRYTGKKAFNSEDLNLQIIEGANVEWRLQFNDTSLNYFMVNAKGERLPLQLQSDGRHSITRTITQTSIYRLSYEDASGYHNLPGVYSIAVTKDKAPKIRIISPNQTLVEIPKSQEAAFAIEATVSDDYGIGEVKILASVAKGSGEAVKFRDETFQFDRQETRDKTNHYFKNWSLKALQMEPGDEVYFSIVAEDNKSPQPQIGKSSSVIVRWLDDEIIETAAEGIQIRFVPEYFRSQRQIIIETEQLIADQKDLSDTAFKEKSVDLGHSQRDLKEKYGQYLGDEFGEGPGEQFGLADGYHGGEDVASGEATAGMEEHGDHDDHDSHDEQQSKSGPDVGHVHADSENQSMIDHSDKSGASELIARFAHNHGTVEVGPMSRRDPKSWMKKAVSIMWQAELHLMMHEPEKALPFEYEAYEYLKLARQAERVYVKRLGFEPPPVKESARLTGELKDILSYELSLEDYQDNEADSFLYQQVYQLLTFWPQNELITPQHKEALSQLRESLLRQSASRPVLVTYAATIERILIKESLLLEDCEDCLVKLKQKLWQLMPQATSLPRVARSHQLVEKATQQSYLRRLRELKALQEDGLQEKAVHND